jgi:hypothetical protein
MLIEVNRMQIKTCFLYLALVLVCNSKVFAADPQSPEKHIQAQEAVKKL